MAKITPFEDILASITKGIGAPPLRSNFVSDVANFNLSPNFLKSQGLQLSHTQNKKVTINNPVAPNKPMTEADIERYSDANAPVRLPQSSTIQQAAYWPDKQYLVVSFKSGHTYDYQQVPVDRVLAWEGAASAGSFFYYNIRMKFKYSKLG